MPSLLNFNLTLRSARIVSDSSPLFRFAMEGNLEEVKKLFASGAASPYDVDVSTRTSALVYATGWSHVHVWRYLLAAGADPYLESTTKHCPMVNVYRSLLEAGKVLREAQSTSPSLQNQSNARDDVIIALREDFDIEEYVERRRFPGHHQIVMGLIVADLETQLQLSTANIDQKDQQGLTALSWAATKGDVASVSTLLRYGADPNAVAFNGDSPLHYAVRAYDPGCVDPLVKYGANVDAQNAWKVTPLHYATMNRDSVQHVAPLVETNANIHLTDMHGRTPLLRAAKYNRPRIAQYLLRAGARLADTDSWDQCPLDVSIDQRFYEVSCVLIENGGASLHDNQIARCFSCVIASGDQRLVKMLQKLQLQSMKLGCDRERTSYVAEMAGA